MSENESENPSGNSSSGAGSAPAKPKRKRLVRRKPASARKVESLPPWNVVLINDDDHSYEYVIEMLRATCGHPDERGYQLAKTVDTTGRAIVFTAHKELAELKRDLIISYGADPRIAACESGMKAELEPAEG
jgi:ATP-dependent Clp protease adaptor protein ClpS